MNSSRKIEASRRTGRHVVVLRLGINRAKELGALTLRNIIIPEACFKSDAYHVGRTERLLDDLRHALRSAGVNIMAADLQRELPSE